MIGFLLFLLALAFAWGSHQAVTSERALRRQERQVRDEDFGSRESTEADSEPLMPLSRDAAAESANHRAPATETASDPAVAANERRDGAGRD